jgi:curli production assembly/transport component CsgE
MPAQEKRKSRAPYLLLAALCGIAPGTASAEPSPKPALPAPSASHNDPYSGIVTNQTITAAGADFFQSFMSAWRNAPYSSRYSLSVHERPSPRWGTHVWILYGVHRVFQLQLPAARAAVRELGNQAAALVLQRVVDQDVAKMLFKDIDMGKDEL